MCPTTRRRPSMSSPSTTLIRSWRTIHPGEGRDHSYGLDTQPTPFKKGVLRRNEKKNTMNNEGGSNPVQCDSIFIRGWLQACAEGLQTCTEWLLSWERCMVLEPPNTCLKPAQLVFLFLSFSSTSSKSTEFSFGRV